MASGSWSRPRTGGWARVEQGLGVAAAAERRVDDDPRGDRREQLDHQVDQHGLVLERGGRAHSFRSPAA